MTIIKDNFTVHNVVCAVLAEGRILNTAISVEFASKLALHINVLNSAQIQTARYALKIYTHWENARNFLVDI
jgi:hypothetical protein